MPIAVPPSTPEETPEFTGAPPTNFTLCEQIGRLWAARSTWKPTDMAQGLTFAEPESTAPSNIYAAPLPDLGQRERIAASITTDDQQRVAPNNPASQFTVSVECHARTPREAVAMGADLVRHLLHRADGGRGWFNEPVTRDGIDISGAIGFPDLDPGEHVGLWRVLTVQLAGGPRWVPQATQAAPGRTNTGQALAVLTLIITAVPLEWIEPEE